MEALRCIRLPQLTRFALTESGDWFGEMTYLFNKIIGVVIFLGAAWVIASPFSNVVDNALAVAFLFGAALVATLAEVRTDPEGIRYRRGFRWRYVAYRDIGDFGRAFAWYYLKLPQPVLPWGVVFVAPAPSFRWPNPIFSEIQRGIERARGARGVRLRPKWFTVLLFVLLGAGATSMVFLVAAPGLPAVLANLPGRGLPQHHLIVTAGPFFWAAVGLVYLVLALLGRRPQLYGFFSGLALGWFAIAVPIVLH